MNTKFRGKRIDNGEWVAGEKVTVGNTVYIVPKDTPATSGFMGGDYMMTLDLCDCHEVIPSTVGMWTGLIDKNGAGIYKDDIYLNAFSYKVRIATGDKAPSAGYTKEVVGFKNGCFTYSVIEQENAYYGKIPSDPKPIWLSNLSKVEVIGTIHDQKESPNEVD